MSFALIEVEAIAKKAARGAGYSWGMAEEAAKATRWLCAHGLDGVGALSALLGLVANSDLADMTPKTLEGSWESKGKEICPLTAGTTLSDAVTFWAEEGKWIENVVVPVMLLPFIAACARQLGTTVTMNLNGAVIGTDGFTTGLIHGEQAGLFARADRVFVKTGGQLGTPLPKRFRATPSDAAWATVNYFAQKTHAPDTEESRTLGAGAGLSDND